MNIEKQKRRIRKMLRCGDDPILSQVCGHVHLWCESDVLLFELMAMALPAFDNGVGLAAPQLGFAQRVIVIWPNRFIGPASPPLVMVNPRIVADGVTVESRWEQCLSYPTLMADVGRYVDISVEYERPIPNNNNFKTAMGIGRICRIQLHGYAARVCQHEIDHLDGICQVKSLGIPR